MAQERTNWNSFLLHAGILSTAGVIGFWSEFFVKSSVYKYVKDVHENPSETINHLNYYYFQIAERYGQGFADFTKNHLGDLMAVISICIITGTMRSFIGADINKTKDGKLILVSLPALACTLVYLIPEIVSMLIVQVNKLDCASGKVLCKGDLGDVLIFSIPIIVGMLYLGLYGNKPESHKSQA